MSHTGPSLRYQAHLRAPSPDPDAGLRDVDHYERKLPRWRYKLRQFLIPLVRWETPYLARLQAISRTPLLDSYFALTANLGTHTFFMTFLPICFWCGFPAFGMGLVHMLAAGVYLSGYAKDLVCLPRPLSPPLHRITMSGSAALEYGFPSTHTTNAVSVALSALHELWQNQDAYSPLMYRLLVAACLCYATSISIGRMYCGMHGFLDVIFGAILGAIIAAIRVAYGNAFDVSVITGSLPYLLFVLMILLLAVRFHPEPADNCPCFDDSVAFIGVVMGCTIASWHYSRFLTAADVPEITLLEMYDYSNRDLLKSIGRLIGGILAIFIWRAVMKSLMLSTLPPVFRFFSQFGVLIPRRFFVQSRDYTTIPPLPSDDKIFPPASEIPAMLSSLRRRKRTISIGPQSEADARELIATRENVRRRANEASRSRSPKRDLSIPANGNGGIAEGSVLMTPDEPAATSSYLSIPLSNSSSNSSRIPSMTSTRIATANLAVLTPPPSSDGGGSLSSGDEQHQQQKEEKERQVENKRLLAAVEKPRIRYDVEVVTKLVVYAGIGWISLEGSPIVFGMGGLA